VDRPSSAARILANITLFLTHNLAFMRKPYNNSTPLSTQNVKNSENTFYFMYSVSG
jgi:hypothetical protein